MKIIKSKKVKFIFFTILTLLVTFIVFYIINFKTQTYTGTFVKYIG